MDAITRSHFDNIHSADREVQGEAYSYLLAATSEHVDWAYEVWDELIQALGHKDNRKRSISAQLLCNLAKSDPRGRILRDFETLLAVTRDDRFVTARHALQSIWHVGTVGRKQQKRVVDGLSRRFEECNAEKNCTLIRYDVIQALRRLYDEVNDEKIRRKALELIDAEDDPKYRRKYATLWK